MATDEMAANQQPGRYTLENAWYRLTVTTQNGAAITTLHDRPAASDLVSTATAPQPLIGVHVILDEVEYYVDSRQMQVTGVTATDQALTLTLTFPIAGDGTVQAVVHLAGSDQPCLRGWVELTQLAGGSPATLVAVDWLPVALDPDAQTWQRPDYEYVPTAGTFTPWQLMMGQPVYVNGFYLGCEFPATDNRIVQGYLRIRNYSGRSLALGTTLSSKVFVLGAAPSTALDAVRAAFFRYIAAIAQPLTFRLQYNSWYDHGMAITAQTVAAAFTEFHAKALQYGLPAIAAYVLDDGWNNYNNRPFKLLDKPRSGTAYNRTGFWEVNAKFGTDLSPLAHLTEQMGSRFGLWFGPQGGYEVYTPFARYLAQRGTGSVDRTMALPDVIDTADGHYIDLVARRLTAYQNQYGIDYWKMDGFASRPSQERNHRHLVGGPHNMYFYTEYWERWLAVFSQLRAARAEQGQGLFINATSYVPLSPWLLQWVNSVWLQNTGDDAQIGTGDPADRRIAGRDQHYFDLFRTAALQFPLTRLYNHEPIYGVSARDITMTAAQFAKYLYWNVFRGPHFIELYYSPSMLDDEKWRITRNALRFAQAHQETLQNVQLLGTDTRTGIYGYWTHQGEKGFLALRNPTAQTQSYALPAALTGRAAAIKLRTLLTFGAPAQVAGTTITLAPGSVAFFALNQPGRVHDLEQAAVKGERLRLTFSQPFNDLAQVTAGPDTLPILSADQDRSAFWVARPAALTDRLALTLTAADGAANTVTLVQTAADFYQNPAIPTPQTSQLTITAPAALPAQPTPLLTGGGQVQLTAQGNQLTLTVAGRSAPVAQPRYTVTQAENGTYGTANYHPQRVRKEMPGLLAAGQTLTLTVVITAAAVEVQHAGRPLAHLPLPQPLPVLAQLQPAAGPFQVTLRAPLA
ncbi:alpha-galactosidase [Schleiferilactobacillus shenzhenensis]|uniref:Alpha-galactosidase n=1 Tax=Schleiferilactobacillus shenzhenensis LY-73 TaxID=1231336 RepID=U4TX05_9LACO|nr:alpha-galactosidase [Schleiferilactobacillus shenzhenensis]ERL65882.1 hypothetical protein L248_1958 [Schleiferilactobacillus shenzhenensis LY-73]